jgi:hypothetical protein
VKFFRIGWVILAVVILGLDAAGIPYGYANFASLCTKGARVCAEDSLLTPEGARELSELGISRIFYAAYQGVGVETVFTLVCFAVAAVIFLRRSDERMALFTSYVLLLFGGAGAAGTMRALAEAHPVFSFPTTLLDYVSQVCFGIFFYLFPDGRFVPRWTRWLAVASALYWVPATFMPQAFTESLFSVVFFVFLGSLVVAQVYRYRRVSTPEQRQQTKWVVFGFTVALAVFTSILLLASFVPPTLQNAGPVGTMVFGTLIYGSLLLIPLSIGLAILHSRLYDIDVIINRALVYGPLTTLLVVIYFGCVVGSQYIIRILTGQDSTLAIVASTLAIAALFNPLRRYLQNFIDRRFYRKKYDAARVLEDFSVRLRDETDLERLNDDLKTVIQETMQPEHVSLWLRPGAGPKSGQTN